MKHLSDTLAISPQIQTTDVTRLVAAGFKSIVCNRPDGEESCQPAFATIAAAAEAAGIRAVHLPVVSGAITGDQVRAFADLLDRLPTPIFAYCRSGGRCEMLWTQAQGR
ncbi:TIGR01244 family sulfur transferase [Elstera cyanobacteriorum]|uniref:TIGR01244 family sulfur transferase n=1 Tax=Elstera cyanobacteriorum TaxID=2022747 RepID=UPI0023579778|nr:TIGR01244 family sulfur transferase [Elstera cyanobacteriorum]MCK6441222.1 TIGR01244 family sulfur transferase [Elstera cyanobacteriorum]